MANERKRFRALITGSALITLAILLFGAPYKIAFLGYSDVVAFIPIRPLSKSIPIAIMNWMLHCANSSIPMVILEPKILAEIDYLDDSDKISNSSENPFGHAEQERFLFRFGIMASDLNFMTRLHHISASLAWRRGSPIVNTSQVFVKNGFYILVSLLETRNSDMYLNGIDIDGVISEPDRAYVGLAIKKAQFDGANDLYMQIPSRRDRYLWQAPRSRHLQCNTTLANRWKAELKAREMPSLPIDFVDELAQLRDVFMEHGVPILLHGATALGWYRHCGHIPTETKVVLAFPATEATPQLLSTLRQSTKFKLHWILGDAKDSLQISLYSNRGLRIDLFALYKGSGFSWIGATMCCTTRTRLRYVYPPLTEICAADLYGQLFHVRCDIVRTLSADYGSFWHSPTMNTSRAAMLRSNVDEVGRWTSSEWNDVYKQFMV